VLLIGGLDPSGRAGLLADVHTVHALGARAAAVATSLTAQGGRRYRAQPVAPALIDAQIEAVGSVDAIKVGVVPNQAVLRVVQKWIRRLRVPAVVDPVTRTSRGETLSSLTPRDFKRLNGVVLTPNASEADAARAPCVVKSVRPACDAVWPVGGLPVLLAGTVLARDPKAHRGTGCRFASALAVALARGEDLVPAAKSARRHVRRFLASPPQ
jgi:hydroxymethylpyrimidine/phosphomethylpyrimidine kinase